MSCIGTFLYDWQTLISGLLAVAAAAWTVLHLKRQVNEEIRRNSEERELRLKTSERRSLASRAGMPLALSELVEYAMGCFDHLNVEKNASRPQLPADAIEDLRASIEYVDDAGAQQLYQLLSQAQIVKARLERPRMKAGPENIDYMYDVVELTYVVNSLYPFARDKDPKAVFVPSEPTRGEYFRALHACGGVAGIRMRHGDYQKLSDEIEAVFAPEGAGPANGATGPASA